MPSAVTYERVVEELRGNREQWQALESQGHCVTLAGPGSGKTKLLTAKMARLLREDVRAPRRVACVTYNNECARELERRLEALGVVGLRNTFVGTLHKFCLRHVIGPLASVAKLDIPQPIQVASDSVQQRLFDEAMQHVGVAAEGFRTDVDRFRRTSLDRHDGLDGWEVGDRGLTDVTIEYERLLRENGLIDFDDIVLLSAKAVRESETVRRCVRARFPVLLVDEYQDLGVPLHRMVLALCLEAGVRLFAVGDPDQSIYGFTGARPGLLRELAGRADVEKVELRWNYRSGRRIVAASGYALGEDRTYQARRNDEGRVEFVHCPKGLDEQVQHAIEVLVPAALQQGDRQGDIALLYPTQQEGDALEAGLAAAGLPFVRLDKGAGYRRTTLVRLLEDMAGWCCGGWREGAPPLSGLLARWRSVIGVQSGARARSARISLVRFLFAHRDPTDTCNAWLSAFDAEVFNQHVRQLATVEDDERDAFDELLSATTENAALAELDVPTFAGKAGAGTHLCLMNLHTAKGTEFNTVIIVGMDGGRMPLYRATSPAEVAEQRRLFFVGVSRAKREVHLLFSGWTMNRYGRRFNQGPSPFVIELQRKLGAARESRR